MRTETGFTISSQRALSRFLLSKNTRQRFSEASKTWGGARFAHSAPGCSITRLQRSRGHETTSTYRFGRGGFTFLEIMLVVAIIGILVSIVGLKLTGRAREAKETTTRLEMHNVEGALEMYEMKAGEYPTTDQGLIALVRCPTGLDANDWRQCMKAEPLDAWGNPFVYRSPGGDGREFDLASCGKDKKAGTGDDIVFSYESKKDRPTAD